MYLAHAKRKFTFGIKGIHFLFTSPQWPFCIVLLGVKKYNIRFVKAVPPSRNTSPNKIKFKPSLSEFLQINAKIVVLKMPVFKGTTFYPQKQNISYQEFFLTLQNIQQQIY